MTTEATRLEAVIALIQRAQLDRLLLDRKSVV